MSHKKIRIPWFVSNYYI